MGQSEYARSVDIPEELGEWLDQEATERDSSPEAILAELLEAHRAIEETPAVTSPNTEPSDIESTLDTIKDRLVQLRRETDQKAPIDHDHETLDTGPGIGTEQLTELKSAIEDIESDLTAIESSLEAGFDNYEDILRYLVDITDTLGERVDTLSRATLDTRETIRQIYSRYQDQRSVATIQKEANKHGIAEANCEDCGKSVHVGQLTEPACPHCSASVTGVSPKGGLSLFGSATLNTGRKPALEGQDVPDYDSEIEEQLEADTPDPADVSWGDSASEQ